MLTVAKAQPILTRRQELGESQAPAYSVSNKGPYDRLKPQWCFNAIHGFVRWYNPSQAFTAKHVSYPKLTATAVTKLALLT